MMASSSSLGVASTIQRRDSKFSKRGSSVISDASQRNVQARRILCFALLFALVVTVVTTVYPPFIARNTHIDGDIVAKRNDKIVTLPLHPQMEKVHGMEQYFLFPSYVAHAQHVKAYTNSTTKNNNFTSKTPSPIKGVLIFLHSCKQSGLDVFHLPESRIVVYDALQKGLAVLAPSALNTESKCFSYQDLDHLPIIVDDWTKNHNLQALPRIGMGESSGASFLFFVHKDLNLQSMAVYNTPHTFLDDEWGIAIPTVMLSMPQDDPVASRMTEHYHKLQQLNVSTQLYEVTPRPFTDSLCMSRFPELPRESCQHMFQHFLDKDDGILLNDDGFAQGSMQATTWTRFFQAIETQYVEDQETTVSTVNRVKTSAVYDTTKAGNGHSWFWAVVEQEVKACQAYHAMTADFHHEVLQFVMSHANISVGDGFP
jgi:hypothetical protein